MLETLEGRLVMSALHAIQVPSAPGIGTISGKVINEFTGKGIKNVQLELINETGAVIENAVTNAKGQYSFAVPASGGYVVHAVAPKRFAQFFPNFPNIPPVGTIIPPYGSNSWTYYTTTNLDPTVGPVNPYAWDTIAPIGNEPFESPINLTGAPIDLSSVLKINYSNTVPKDIINNGHQIQVQYPSNNPNDTIMAGGQLFNLAQFHYHAPSETLVNGQPYALEEHFVNTSAAGGETVLAVFLQLGAHNDALDPILNAAMTSLRQPNSTTTIKTPIDFAGLLPTSMEGWFYQGSLTTPPLSQPVNWFVFSTPITLDAQQLSEYQAVAAGAGFFPNNRPVQPTDGRVLNEVNYDVNYTNQSFVGLNFGYIKQA